MAKQKWQFYDLGGYALGVSPNPEKKDQFGLFLLIGENGYPLAVYPDEAAAAEALEVLDAAMHEIAQQHVACEHCELETAEKKGGARKKSARANGSKKPAGKSARSAGKTKAAAKPAGRKPAGSRRSATASRKRRSSR